MCSQCQTHTIAQWQTAVASCSSPRRAADQSRRYCGHPSARRVLSAAMQAEPEPERLAGTLTRVRSSRERAARSEAEAVARQLSHEEATLDAQLADVQRELRQLKLRERATISIAATSPAPAAEEMAEAPPHFQWMYADTNPLAQHNPLRWSAATPPLELAEQLCPMAGQQGGGPSSRSRPILMRVVHQAHTETFPSQQAAADWLRREGAEQLEPSDVSCAAQPCIELHRCRSPEF